MSQPAKPASPSKVVFWVLNALLGVAFALEISAPKLSSMLDAAYHLAAAATVAALHRQLPLQNVVPAALIAALIGSVAHGLSSNPNLSMPFGPIVFNPSAGEKIFDFVPWTIPRSGSSPFLTRAA